MPRNLDRFADMAQEEGEREALSTPIRGGDRTHTRTRTPTETCRWMILGRQSRWSCWHLIFSASLTPDARRDCHRLRGQGGGTMPRGLYPPPSRRSGNSVSRGPPAKLAAATRGLRLSGLAGRRVQTLWSRRWSKRPPIGLSAEDGGGCFMVLKVTPSCLWLSSAPRSS